MPRFGRVAQMRQCGEPCKWLSMGYPVAGCPRRGRSPGPEHAGDSSDSNQQAKGDVLVTARLAIHHATPGEGPGIIGLTA